MSDGTAQYQSAMALGTPINQKTAFTFNIIASENYMVEAWHFNNSTNKLVLAAVKYV